MQEVTVGHCSERWRAIPSVTFAGVTYEASTHGNIRRVVPATSKKFGKCLKGRVGNAGYLYLNLSIKNKVYCRYVHKLVAEAFHGPVPDGHFVDHKDTDKGNNRPDNLQYITRKESCQQGFRMGFLKSMKTGEDHPFAVLTTKDVRKMRRLNGQGWSYNRLAKRFGRHPSHVRSICIRDIWAHVV
jgi:hypothetical protein